MGVNDHLFEPPPADLAKINARLGNLPPSLRMLLQRAGDALASGDAQTAQRTLTGALALAPGQPDVLRLYALLLAQVGNLRAAAANFDVVLQAVPDDAIGYCQYARMCEDAGDVATALRLREHAAQRLPDSPLAWADLGEHLVRHQRHADAVNPLERALRLAPGYPPALLKLGEALVACGDAKAGAASIREALAREPGYGLAWHSLVDIKTVPIQDAEAEQMAALLRGSDIAATERTVIEYALAKVYEDAGRYQEALPLFVDANARRRREIPAWNAAQFVARVQRGHEVFAAAHARASDPGLGAGAIFIVGMPRSGTTLVEQILASHPDVEGLGELGMLAQVLAKESASRQRHYPEWVPEVSAHDWQRLGRRYLALIAPLRNGDHPRFTDKLPDNWQTLGAIRAMLPGARIVVCRRDPLETCFSCYRQHLAGNEWTRTPEDLAAFWHDFDRTANHFAALHPARVHQHDYEALVADPEQGVRRLLDACDLPFEEACLRFYASGREVRSPSATQVRQPLHAGTARAQEYGALLDPIRLSLGMPAFGA